MQATPALLGSLQKNSKGVFFDLLTMQKLNYFNMTNLTKLSDGFTYDFPFSLGFESDIIRYSWFDWYSVRNSIVTKAMDTSVFNLHGSKDYNYSFANNTTVNSINKTDNFFLRYLFARKLYIQSFTYNPFFLSTNFTGSFFNSYTSLLPLQSYEAFKFFNAKVSYFCMSQYSVEGGVLNQPLTRFNSLNSSTLSPLRAYIGSLDITANQTDLLTNLVDILSKKEYIIKSIDTDHFTYSMNKNYLLKSQASLKNPLILTLKAVFNSTELGSPRSTKTSNKIFFQAYNKFTPLNPLDSAQLSLKSQYQPLRKGIINMIRIQADKAVAMPTDTRLQILAVSKDIIHSWAIPSAGIKIDCIPGYSSHRLAIFTLSGVYWGQCMEICGRFHHWMPIVVYFLRRDLFCLWCLHFIFKNNQSNSTLQALDWDYSDTTAQLSYSTDTWSHELL